MTESSSPPLTPERMSELREAFDDGKLGLHVVLENHGLVYHSGVTDGVQVLAALLDLAQRSIGQREGGADGERLIAEIDWDAVPRFPRIGVTVAPSGRLTFGLCDESGAVIAIVQPKDARGFIRDCLLVLDQPGVLADG